MYLTYIFVTVCTAILIAWLYIRRAFTYWQREGVIFVKPSFPFGNIKGLAVKSNMAIIMRNLYNQLAGRDVIAGMYFFTQPALIVLDPELVKSVLQTDFQYFIDRGIFWNEKDDPLSAHLFSLEGQRWRTLRAKLTPTFTSGKMKAMFDIVLAVGDRLTHEMDTILNDQCDIEVKDIFARYTTDSIGSCAFGIECNSLDEPNCEFRQISQEFFNLTKLKALKMFFTNTFIPLSRFLRLRTTEKHVSDFFQRIVRETVAYRETHDVKRKDFMSLLIDVKNTRTGHEAAALTMDEVAAQAFLFFIAGFETSSLTLTFTAYELAVQPLVQERARQEVRKLIAKHNGQLTYECVMENSYLDQIINETLRKHPPVENLLRKANADYKVPNSGYTIKKDTTVIIPIFALHYDPIIFPDPERYDPDRFSDEAKEARHSFTHMPFGLGPRACIGMRFGLMQVKIGLIKMLLNYKFSVAAKTLIPMEYEPAMPTINPLGGCWLRVERL